MWFMGINLLVNFILQEVFEKLNIANCGKYMWWINVVLNIFIIGVWICIWKRTKERFIWLKCLRV